MTDLPRDFAEDRLRIPTLAAAAIMDPGLVMMAL